MNVVQYYKSKIDGFLNVRYGMGVFVVLDNNAIDITIEYMVVNNRILLYNFWFNRL